MGKFIYNEQLIISNIEEVFMQGTSSDLAEAKKWYKNAKAYAQDMSEEFGVPVIKCCALISVLSPQKEWWQNIKLTRSFLRSRGKHCKHFGQQVDKARNIYEHVWNGEYWEIDEILNGKKTTNFFHNIYTPSSPFFVTIDSHMIQICTGRMDIKTVTKNQYEFLAKILKNQAKVHNFIPSEFQSLLWLTWKRIKPRYNQLK